MLKRILLSVVMLVVFCGVVSAKKMAILNFNKGEVANMNNACAVSLTEEQAEKSGEFTMKAEFEAKSSDKAPWAAVMGPERASWIAYKTVNVEVFNPGDKEVKFTWMIKGAKGTDGPDNRRDWDIKFPPGKSTQQIKIANEVCNDGKSPLDLKRIYIWAFWAQDEKPVTLYFQKLYLAD